MAHTILATDQTETSDDQILGKDWAGKYQLLCTVYAADPVKIQVRRAGRNMDKREIQWHANPTHRGRRNP